MLPLSRTPFAVVFLRMPLHTPPSSPETQAKAMFTRVLAAWTADLLNLRRAGLLTPSHRHGTPDPVIPMRPRLSSEPRWHTADPAAALRWRAA